MEPNKNNDFGKNLRNIILAIGVPVLLFLAIMFLFFNKAQPKKLQYSDVVSFFEEGKVEKYTLDLGTGELQLTLSPEFREDLDITLDDEGTFRYMVPDTSLFYDNIKELVNEVNRDDNPDNDITYDYEKVKQVHWIVSLIPTILIIVFFIVMYVMMRRSLSSIDGSGKNMGFGKARVKQTTDDNKKTTFDDVAGADEEKEELREIVDFLKQPKKYLELGARVPKGVLLLGPPGTGKTLLARAVAGEASVPFFSMSGSDFVEMYVGVGASRVRDLFSQAKKSAPCIIFVDEIDAVGRQRGAGLGGGHDEREQTLNQLLVEMDGFGVNEGVIMIAATNRPDVLDPALTRPGRFDRQIVVNYPDIKGREAILHVHARGKPLAPDVNLATIAKTTVGFTGADLENLLNEAALLSARHGLRSITMEQIEEATIKVIVGTEKRSHVITEKDKRLTSYHEAGHALVSYFSPTQDPVHQISIIPRGMAGGYTLNLPEQDQSYMLKNEMLESLQVLLGGRVSESLVLDDISTGASNDIERATKTAQNMVVKYGMSDKVGPIVYTTSEGSEVFLGRDIGQTKTFSDEISSLIDNEIRDIINSAYVKAEKKISENMDKLHDVAKFLLENEKMDADQFRRVMEGKDPMVDDNPKPEESEEIKIEDDNSEISEKPENSETSEDSEKPESPEKNIDN